MGTIFNIFFVKRSSSRSFEDAGFKNGLDPVYPGLGWFWSSKACRVVYNSREILQLMVGTNEDRTSGSNGWLRHKR